MKKMYYSNVVNVKKSVLDNYPPDIIKRTDLNIKKGFKLIEIYYRKPLGDNFKTKIKFHLKDANNDSFKITQDIKFQFCENDYFAKKISPSSFVLKSHLIESYPPSKISVEDFEFGNPIVQIIDVEYKEPLPSVKDTFAKIVIRIKNLNSVMKIKIPLSFTFTKEEYIITNVKKDNFSFLIEEDDDLNVVIKDTKYIGDHNVEIVQSKIASSIYNKKWWIQIHFRLGKVFRWIKFLIDNPIPDISLEFNERLQEMTIDPSFLFSCSPINPDPSFLKFSEDLELVALNFIPPKNIGSYRAKAICLFKYKNKAFRRTIRFKFRKSLIDRANEIQKEIKSNEIKYLRYDEIKYPPEKYSIEDFKMSHELVTIKKINCDFKQIDQNDKKVVVEIVADFRGVEIIWEKELEYEMSRLEFMASTFLYDKLDKKSIGFSKDIMDPNILYEWSKNNGYIPEEVFKKFVIEKYYYFEITKARIQDFSIYSRKFKIVLTISQELEKRTIENVISHPIILKESYVEKNLGKVKPKQIEVRKELLPSYPPTDFRTGTFISGDQFDILGYSYIKPPKHKRIAYVRFKIIAGNKIRFIEKKIEFEMSHQEYNEKIEYEQEKKYLNSIKASSISLHINVLGPPLEKIMPENISGIPDGVNFIINYKKPNFGKKVGLLGITLFKEKSYVSFSQEIFFALPRTKESYSLYKNYLKNKNYEIKDRRKWGVTT